MTNLNIKPNTILFILLLICVICLVALKGDTLNYYSYYNYDYASDITDDIQLLSYVNDINSNCDSVFITEYNDNEWYVFVENKTVCKNHGFYYQYCHVPVLDCLSFTPQIK